MSKREQFSKVSPALWRSKRFLALSSEERLLLLYYIASRHQTSAGCYRIAEGYACSDLGWDPERYRAARMPLVESGLILFDETTEEVFVPGWFKVCAPNNQRHAASMTSGIAEIESDWLRKQVDQEFMTVFEPLAQRWAEVPSLARNAGMNR